MIRACEKTGVTQTTLESIIDEIEAQLQVRERHQVTSVEIGEMILQYLQDINEVAYVRFASVYRQFRGVRDFAEALNHFDAK